MTITPNPPANFTPSMQGYTGQGAFRYWCQKVLPIVYDDSLSYYELLNKVVDYLNKAIADVANVETNVDSLLNAYNQLQGYVNNYFYSLDVQQEINQKLDSLVSDGTLSTLVGKIIGSQLPPIFVQSTGEMTNHDRVYVLTGNNHIYTWNEASHSFLDTGATYSIPEGMVFGYNGKFQGEQAVDLDTLIKPGYYYIDVDSADFITHAPNHHIIGGSLAEHPYRGWVINYYSTVEESELAQLYYYLDGFCYIRPYRGRWSIVSSEFIIQDVKTSGVDFNKILTPGLVYIDDPDALPHVDRINNTTPKGWLITMWSDYMTKQSRAAQMYIVTDTYSKVYLRAYNANWVPVDWLDFEGMITGPVKLNEEPYLHEGLWFSNEPLNVLDPPLPYEYGVDINQPWWLLCLATSHLQGISSLTIQFVFVPTTSHSTCGIYMRRYNENKWTCLNNHNNLEFNPSPITDEFNPYATITTSDPGVYWVITDNMTPPSTYTDDSTFTGTHAEGWWFPIYANNNYPNIAAIGMFISRKGLIYTSPWPFTTWTRQSYIPNPSNVAFIPETITGDFNPHDNLTTQTSPGIYWVNTDNMIPAYPFNNDKHFTGTHAEGWWMPLYGFHFTSNVTAVGIFYSKSGQIYQTVWPFNQWCRLGISINNNDIFRTMICGDSLQSTLRPNGVSAKFATFSGQMVYDCGFGGTRLANNDNWHDDQNLFSFQNLLQAKVSGDFTELEEKAATASPWGEDYTDALKTFKDCNFDQLDYLVIAYGTNDWYGGNSLESYEAEIRSAVNIITSRWPRVQPIFVCPPWRIVYNEAGDRDGSTYQIGGHTLADFGDKVREVCTELKCKYIDAYHELTWNTNNARTVLSDGTHPNATGIRQYASMLARHLRTSG